MISASGIGATLALTVSQRANELGIRMALGAERAGIVRMVVAQGLRLVAIGIAAGMVGAMALSSIVQSLLFDTSPKDAAAFLAAGTVACLIPARQITHIDPLVALRQE